MGLPSKEDEPKNQPQAVKRDFQPRQLHKLKSDITKANNFLSASEMLEWEELLAQLDEEGQLGTG